MQRSAAYEKITRIRTRAEVSHAPCPSNSWDPPEPHEPQRKGRIVAAPAARLPLPADRAAQRSVRRLPARVCRARSTVGNPSVTTRGTSMEQLVTLPAAQGQQAAAASARTTNSRPAHTACRTTRSRTWKRLRLHLRPSACRTSRRSVRQTAPIRIGLGSVYVQHAAVPAVLDLLGPIDSRTANCSTITCSFS